MGNSSSSVKVLREKLSVLRAQNAALEDQLGASEADRRQYEERFDDLAQNLGEVFWICAPDLTKILYVSPAYEEIWGRSCQSLYENPKSFLEAIHPQDQARIIARIESQALDGFCEEYRIIRPDGEIRWIRDRAFPITDKSGQVPRVVGVAEDVTHFKTVEESLRRYEQIVSSTDNLMAFVGRDYRYQAVSKKFAEAIGKPQECILDRFVADVVGTPTFEKMKPHLDQCLLGKPDDFEHWFDMPDGSRRYFLEHFNPYYELDGSISGIVVDVHDISARREEERVLVEGNCMLALDVEVRGRISQSQGIQGLLQGCTEALVQHLDVAFARIWTLDKEEQVLKLQASAGLYTHLDGPHSRVAVGHLKIGQIAAEKRPHLTNAVIGDPRVPEQEWAKQEGLVAFAGYPLLRNQEVLGVMALFSTHPLSEFTLKGLQIVANQITTAVEYHMGRESQQKLAELNKQILGSVTEGIYGLDLQGKTTFVNQAGARMLGYEVEELLGLPMHATVHHTKPDGSVYLEQECPIYTTYKDGMVQYVDTDVLWRKDGTSFSVEYTSTPIWHNGKLTGGVVTFQDIAERLQAEETLKKSRQDFQALVDSLEGIVWECDFPSYRFTFVSQQAERLLGYPTDQWLTQPNFYCDHLHEADKSWALDHCRQATLRKKNHEMECRFYHANGQVVWLRDLVTVVVENEKPVKLRGVMFDITHIKQAEKVLQESEERFRLLNQMIPQQVWTAQPNGALDYVNQRVVEYLGRPIEQIMAQGLHQVLHPDDLPETLKQWAKARETHQPFEIEFRLKGGKDNTYRWHLSRAIPVFNQLGQVVKWFGTNTDITDFKQWELQIRQAQKMEAIGTLAGGIAHDFNNILMAIMGYAELAKLNVRGNDGAQRNLKEVLIAGQRAKALVKQILTFSRQTEQVRQPLEIQLVVKEVLKFLRATLPMTIEIRMNFTEESTNIWGDPIQIHQVVMNLCTNAEHAMRESGGVLEISLERVDGETLSLDQHLDLNGGPYVCMKVRDTGRGMTPEVVRRIFDPFFTTKGVGEGTGMGLAVVHGIVTSHGGGITVDSESDKGTVFVIYFPWLEAGSLPTQDDKLEQECLHGRGHILFVEDEEPLAKLGKDALESLGYEVVIHTSSVEALEVFRRDPFRFDAVITDQTMPNLTGEGLAREMLHIRSDLPIILCTGFSHVITPERAKTIGIQAYLLKPLLLKDLGRTLREVLHPEILTKRFTSSF